MLLEEARTRTKTALHALDESTPYGPEHIDRGLLTVLHDFVQQVRPVVTSGTVALGGTSAAVTLGTATFQTFRPERYIRFEIRKYDQPADEPGHILSQQKYGNVANTLRRGSAASTSGDPTAIAFRSPLTAFLDRAPGTVYPDGRLTWYDTLNEWTPGTVTAGTSVTLNVPDEYLAMPLWFGAAAVVQHTDPAALFQTEAWRRYEEYRDRMKGRATWDAGEDRVDPCDYL